MLFFVSLILVFKELTSEAAKYLFPNRRFETRSFEEALMSVPDLETVEFKVLSRNDNYEIREVEPYFIAETTMPGKFGFDFTGASQSFNVLAAYLFGKNTKEKQMEMTTPVFTRRIEFEGEKMEMTTPVITRRVEDEDKWKMSFVMPSKYGSNLPLPKDSSVTIKEVPKKIIAVVVFSGFVTDEEVARRESTLRVSLNNDTQFRVKEGASLEVAQYNPPFTLPFARRNEISLEILLTNHELNTCNSSSLTNYFYTVRKANCFILNLWRTTGRGRRLQAFQHQMLQMRIERWRYNTREV